jgi:[ribosomal protein S18]-alanine N-acetyltransferase
VTSLGKSKSAANPPASRQPMSIIVENATIQMLDTLFNIEKQSFKEEAFSKLQLEYVLEDPAGISLVARLDGKLAGFVMGRFELDRWGLAGHVMTIDVLPIFRRRGVAVRLMLEIESRFRASGAQESRLEVRQGNAAARGLYQKLGYVEVTVLRGYYRGAHGLYLCKRLEKMNP